MHLCIKIVYLALKKMSIVIADLLPIGAAVVLCLALGVSPSWAASPIGTNLLGNAGFESDAHNNGEQGVLPYVWTQAWGNWARVNNSGAAHGGNYYYYCSGVANTRIAQLVIIPEAQLDADRLSTGGYYVEYGGWQRSYYENFLGIPLPRDPGQITLMTMDGNGNELDSLPLGWTNSTSWIKKSGTVRLNSTIKSLAYIFDGDWNTGTNNDAYLDDAYVKIHAPNIWTWGATWNYLTNSITYTGSGPWNPVSSSLIIGKDASGGVSVTNSSVMNTTNKVVLGWGAAGRGIVNLNGGTWNAGGDTALLGKEGHGTVNINAGGIWNSNHKVELSKFSRGRGTVNINANGVWNSNQQVSLGLLTGQGTININSGGKWNANGNVSVGAGGTGYIKINSGGLLKTEGTTALAPRVNGAANVVYLKGGTWQANGPVTISGTSFIQIELGTMNILGSNLQLGGSSGGIVQMFGGELNITGDVSLDRFGFYGGTLSVSGEMDWSINTLGDGTISQRLISLTGPSASWTVDTLTVDPKGTLTLDGGMFGIADGGTVDFDSAIDFTANGGLIQLTNAHLIHDVQTLNLMGNTLTGHGQLTVGVAGVNLGNQTKSGSIVGTSTTDRIAVDGNVSGCGTLTNVTVNGNVNVGNSVGVMIMNDVNLGDNATLIMEISGVPDELNDQIIFIGDMDFSGVDLDVTLNDYVLKLDDEFQLFDLSGAVVTGTLDQLNLPSLAPELDWDTSTIYVNGTITVIDGIIFGDVNGDGLVDGFDVDPFVDVLLNGPYQAEADVNEDGLVNGFDVDPFVVLVLGGGSGPEGTEIPEPATLILLGLGGLVAMRRQR